MDLTSFTQSPSSSISAFQSDFVTLLVGPDEENFTIHQDIITKARYFAGCLGYTLQESHTRIIRLPEDEPAVIAKVVEYLYSGKFEVKIFEDEIESHKEGSQIRLVVNSYIVADKYCMEHLQNMAMDLLRDIRFIGATTTLSMLAEANLLQSPMERSVLQAVARGSFVEGYDWVCKLAGGLHDLIGEGVLFLRS